MRVSWVRDREVHCEGGEFVQGSFDFMKKIIRRVGGLFEAQLASRGELLRPI